MQSLLQNFINKISLINTATITGKVIGVNGSVVEVEGLESFASIGSRCRIYDDENLNLIAEVVGIKNQNILLMPFSDIRGIKSHSKVEFLSKKNCVYPTKAWLGRVLNGFGEPIDDKGQITQGDVPYNIYNTPPLSHSRKRVGAKINLGIRAINAFASCCLGQRMGIFAGSGVGKSMMLAMMTKFADTDIKVIGLIGERGREVQEFLQDYLGEEGLKKAVVIVATSDESALMRKQAAYLTLTISEYYRDQGLDVLCLMDSITRFATAQREIGLASGEPPTTKGYTPSVFSILSKLLERAGPGKEGDGSITGLFSVLVEGDDHHEPVADSVRSIIDGHIVLERAIAERGIYPAINVLKSISRMMPGCNSDDENALIAKARSMIATYEDMADMIRIGIYKKGSDLEVDEAISRREALNAFISQSPDTQESLESSYKKLAEALGV